MSGNKQQLGRKFRIQVRITCSAATAPSGLWCLLIRACWSEFVACLTTKWSYCWISASTGQFQYDDLVESWICCRIVVLVLAAGTNHVCLCCIIFPNTALSSSSDGVLYSYNVLISPLGISQIPLYPCTALRQYYTDLMVSESDEKKSAELKLFFFTYKCWSRYV